MSSDYISPWWQAILLPDRWDVCGIAVHALSNWHLYALENLRNAYVCGGIHDRDSAASLLLICQREMRRRPWHILPGGRDLYLRPYARARALARIHKVVKPIPWDDLDNACSDYVRSCLRVPRHKTASASSAGASIRLLAAPYLRHIVLCLCDHYNMTRDQAWNHPYSESRCMYDTYREIEKGDDTLFREDQMERKEEYIAKHGGHE